MLSRAVRVGGLALTKYTGSLVFRQRGVAAAGAPRRRRLVVSRPRARRQRPARRDGHLCGLPRRERHARRRGEPRPRARHLATEINFH